MVEVTVQVRMWGRSLGVVIPKETVKQGHFKAGEKVQLIIFKKKNPLKETFGTLKLKRSTEEILKETDRELWND